MRRRTKQIFISGIIGIILIIAWFFLKEALYGHKKYRDNKKGFSISYPRTWEKSKNTAGAAALFLSPKSGEIDTFRENVSVVVQPLGIDDTPDNLAAYSTLAVDQIAAVFGENLKVLENNPLWEMDNHAAHRFSFIGFGPETNYKYLMVWALAKDKKRAYQVTYAGTLAQFDYFLKDAERMIKSFNIKD